MNVLQGGGCIKGRNCILESTTGHIHQNSDGHFIVKLLLENDQNMFSESGGCSKSVIQNRKRNDCHINWKWKWIQLLMNEYSELDNMESLTREAHIMQCQYKYMP